MAPPSTGQAQAPSRTWCYLPPCLTDGRFFLASADRGGRLYARGRRRPRFLLLPYLFVHCAAITGLQSTTVEPARLLRDATRRRRSVGAFLPAQLACILFLPRLRHPRMAVDRTLLACLCLYLPAASRYRPATVERVGGCCGLCLLWVHD